MIQNDAEHMTIISIAQHMYIRVTYVTHVHMLCTTYIPGSVSPPDSSLVLSPVSIQFHQQIQHSCITRFNTVLSSDLTQFEHQFQHSLITRFNTFTYPDSRRFQFTFRLNFRGEEQKVSSKRIRCSILQQIIFIIESQPQASTGQSRVLQACVDNCKLGQGTTGCCMLIHGKTG